MINNKRVDNNRLDSKIQFSHNDILRFLEEHKAFVKPEQVIKIFIKARKFRLSLQYMHLSKVPFQLDYFITAIENNCYDVAFYLLGLYEDEIVANANRVIETHVKSYALNKLNLKCKLYLSNRLLGLFNFKSVKELLDIISIQLHDTSLEGNIFSHSCNPLLTMCLMYELLINIIKRFFSLNNICRTIMKTTMELAITFIDCVDNE